MMSENRYSVARVRLKIPTKSHPMVKTIFRLINDQGLMLKDVAERSGVDIKTIGQWRTRTSPSLASVEAVLGALDYEIRLFRKKGTADPKPKSPGKVRNPAREWPQEKVDELIACWGTPEPRKQLAHRLGYATVTVYQQARRLGLPALGKYRA